MRMIGSARLQQHLQTVLRGEGPSTATPSQIAPATTYAIAPKAAHVLILTTIPSRILAPGALEYNAAGLNRTWFFPQPAKGQLPGDHWHAIYAASFKPTGTTFPLAWAPEDESVPGVDVTQAYIDADISPAAAAPVAAGTADSRAGAEGMAEQ